MEFTSVKVSDDSSVSSKSSTSLGEISSDFSASSSETASSDTMSIAFDWAEKLLSYEELVEKYVQCEEELKTISLKLQESEQEIEKQKSEAKKRESDLHAKLEITTNKLQEFEEENEKLKNEAQKKAFEIEAAQREIETNNKALKVIKGILDESYVEISDLKAMLNDVQISLTTEIMKLEGKFSELNKEFERSYENLMEENDQNCDAIANLKALLAFSETKNGEMMEELNHLNSTKNRLENELGEAKKTEKILSSRVEEQVELHRNAFKTTEKKLRDYIKYMEKREELLVKEAKNQEEFQKISEDTAEEMRDYIKYLEKKEELHVEELKKQVELQKNTEEKMRDRIEELEEQAEVQRNAMSKLEKDKTNVIRGLYLCLDHYNVSHEQIMEFFSSSSYKPS